MRKSYKKNKIFRNISKKLYLIYILDRLNQEYIPILEMVINYNSSHKESVGGFWSFARIIFPVIEAVAFAIGKSKQDFLQEDLNVPFSHLVWELYRHPLMHSDQLNYGLYKDKTILWAIHLDNELSKHFVAKATKTHPTTIHVAVPMLYYDLKEFLIKEIAKNNNSIVQIQIGAHFPENEGKLANELKKIYKEF